MTAELVGRNKIYEDTVEIFKILFDRFRKKETKPAFEKHLRK